MFCNPIHTCIHTCKKVSYNNRVYVFISDQIYVTIDVSISLFIYVEFSMI